MSVIPGTTEPGYEEQPLVEFHRPDVRAFLKGMGALGLKFYRMGECTVMVSREPVGPDGTLLWHLSVSHPERHPTWDEIKSARYRLLRTDICFGILLPPPEYYVNVPEQDHVFHLWEVTDPRAPWEAG